MGTGTWISKGTASLLRSALERTQDNPHGGLFNHYAAQAQQPSPAQLSLQHMAQLLGPPLPLQPRRENLLELLPCRPNLPNGPPAPGIIFGNVTNSVIGAADLAPKEAFDYQPPTPEDLARCTHYGDGRSGVRILRY